jgi:hypothetical protein
MLGVALELPVDAGRELLTGLPLAGGGALQELGDLGAGGHRMAEAKRETSVIV